MRKTRTATRTAAQREEAKIRAMIDRADVRIAQENVRRREHAALMKTYTKRLTVRLPEDFHKQLRLHAVSTGEPMQTMVERLLRGEVERAEAHTPRKKQR